MRSRRPKEAAEEGALEVTPMRRRDLKAVMAIEARVFPEPWSKTVFTSELALRHGRAYRVGRLHKNVVGYFGLMFVEDESHITTVAVAPEHQGLGLGKALMAEIVHLSIESGARHLSLEVAAGNDRAQRLYERFGFAPVGLRKHYYPATGEDAIVMWARDIDSPAYGERLRRLEAELRFSG